MKKKSRLQSNIQYFHIFGSLKCAGYRSCSAPYAPTLRLLTFHAIPKSE